MPLGVAKLAERVIIGVSFAAAPAVARLVTLLAVVGVFLGSFSPHCVSLLIEKLPHPDLVLLLDFELLDVRIIFFGCLFSPIVLVLADYVFSFVVSTKF